MKTSSLVSKFFYILIFLILVFISGCQRQVILEEKPLNGDLASIKQEQAEAIKKEIEVPIIIYHHIKNSHNSIAEADKDYTITVDNFRAQMDYLAERGFTTISISDISRYFSGDFKLPDKPIAITFDDGLISQYQNAWPILKDRDLKATFFVFVNPIGKNDNYLNWQQVKELADAGSEIADHGYYHLFWDKISESELSREIVISKELIESKIGRTVTAAAYPFGQFDEQVTQALKDAGYLAARDIINGRFHQSADLFKLKAYFITNDFNRFKSIVGD